MMRIDRIARYALLLVVYLVAVIVIAFQSSQSGVASSALAEEAVNINQNVYLPLVARTSGPIPLYGVQTYGSVHLDHLADSGARWVRIHAKWREIEPNDVTPRVYNWRAVDLRLSPLAELPGVNLIVTVDGTPDWASPFGSSGPGGPIRQDKLANYAALVQELVERYDGDGYADAPGSPVIRYWEFYNEPDRGNTPSDIRWGNYGGQYANMLQAVYPAVKAASPQAKVVFGGIAYDWFEPDGPFVESFVDDVLAAGGGAFFDVMNFHAYPAFAGNWASQGPGLLEKSEFLRAKLLTYGLDKPLIITEAGWHSNPSPDYPNATPEIQARYVVQLFTQAKAARLELMIWWMLHDPGGFYPYDNGLVTFEGVRKSAFFAYQTLVSQLQTAHFVRKFSAAETGVPNMELYEFDDPFNNRTVYVAWLNPVDTMEVQAWHLNVSQATVRNIYGNGIVMNAVPGSPLVLNVTAQPMYVEVYR
jgi:hypothetical protein